MPYKSPPLGYSSHLSHGLDMPRMAMFEDHKLRTLRRGMRPLHAHVSPQTLTLIFERMRLPCGVPRSAGR